MAAITNCSDFGAQKNKVCHCFPNYLPWSDGTRCLIFVFWMLSFKQTFSLSSFPFIKRLFSSSFSAIKVVSSVYLRFFIFLMAILILSDQIAKPVPLITTSTTLIPEVHKRDGSLSQGGLQCSLALAIPQESSYHRFITELYASGKWAHFPFLAWITFLFPHLC